MTALVLLDAYTATGAAGDPAARISVANGRVFVPLSTESTAAFFGISDTGACEDLLESVSSTSLRVTVPSRNVSKDGVGRMEAAGPLTIPARSRVRLTPFDVGIMVLDPPKPNAGDRVGIDLWFRSSGLVHSEAVVVPARW
ncbi:copper chaperone PCu(A)C [Streptomyces palmae]|uniref:copper chaperone PCu(A)C n=1 Tax=Streptomyces palmae TaxID=1701085 RepID=UPI00143311AA|nr:copper chaperone PCu(A)C [Streptomyces palmae]